MNIESILNRIPDSKTFFTVDELAAKGQLLQKRYPDVITRYSAGRSRAGDDLWCLKLGSGKKNALCFACPHPNEPIGAMTLLALTEILASDPSLLHQTGMTWYLIPCIDPDGTRLNEGWLKGPYCLEQYVRGFYRPPGSRQVEWTFPFRHQNMFFDRPLPETKVLMDMIGALKPALVYSLHNSAFGGAYFYITHNDPTLNAKLEGAALRQNIPLHLGEPESPYITKYARAVHSMMSLHKYYDYRERQGLKLPEGEQPCGTLSADYISTVCDSLVLMAELPYFLVRGIDDETPWDESRRDVLLKKTERRAHHASFLRECWHKVRSLFEEDNPFPLLVDDALAAYESEDGTGISGAEYDRPATSAEALDSLLLTRIFEALDLALAMRACDFSILRCKNPDTAALLKHTRQQIDSRLKNECLELENGCAYEAASIRRLVSVQLESVLRAIPYCP